MQFHFLYSLLVGSLWLLTADTGTLLNNSPVQSVLQKEAPESLSILTLNTWALPVRLSGHDQEKRFEMIPKELLDVDADIVCLQECFAQDLRKSLCSSLDDSYDTLSDHSCYRRSMLLLMMDCYGGLMTFSKYPIVEESFYKFPLIGKSRIVERIGSKGFLVSTIDLDGTFIQVVNTHLYAGTDDKAERHRERQLQYMTQVLDSIQSVSGHDLVLTGDLNINHSSNNTSVDETESNQYQYLTREALYHDPVNALSDRDFTMDVRLNPYAHGVAESCKIDYCLIKSADVAASPYHMSSEVIFNRPGHILSDHFGLFTMIYGINTRGGYDSVSHPPAKATSLPMDAKTNEE